jgi:hypothetical protein
MTQTNPFFPDSQHAILQSPSMCNNIVQDNAVVAVWLHGITKLMYIVHTPTTLHTLCLTKVSKLTEWTAATVVQP